MPVFGTKINKNERVDSVQRILIAIQTYENGEMTE